MGRQLKFIFCIFLVWSIYPVISKEPDFDYHAAFDQEEIYKKHAFYLRYIGSGQNTKLLPEVETEEQKKKRIEKEKKEREDFYLELENFLGLTLEKESHPLKRVLLDEKELHEGLAAGKKLSFEYLDKCQHSFEQDCLAQLKYQRNLPIYASFGKAIVNALMIFGARCLGTYLVGDKVGSDAVKSGEIASASAALYQFKDPIMHVPDLVHSSKASVKDLEEFFACNKCYIPNKLWPRIMRLFMLIHKDEMNSKKYIDCLEYALGFTVYKPKPAIEFAKNQSADDIKKELDRRIDNFFKDYTLVDKMQRESLENIKLNIFKFIDSLHNKEITPTPIYLYGPGGIGKTYFVKKLFEWIDELIPEAITFENVVIDAPEKLEGTTEHSGVFLNVMYNQLTQKKHASIVIMDEASFIGSQKPEMNDAIKRTFNSGNEKLYARCFGSDINGPIQLEKPKMLVVLAGNIPLSKIPDKSVSGRFINFNFLFPDMSLLVQHGLKIINDSNNIDSSIKSFITKDNIESWISSLPELDRNFRYIKQNIETHFRCSLF